MSRASSPEGRSAGGYGCSTSGHEVLPSDDTAQSGSTQSAPGPQAIVVEVVGAMAQSPSAGHGAVAVTVVHSAPAAHPAEPLELPEPVTAPLGGEEYHHVAVPPSATARVPPASLTRHSVPSRVISPSRPNASARSRTWSSLTLDERR